MPKTVMATLVGFASSREFYVPRYSQPITPGSSLDRWDVLYWQALGQTDVDGLGRTVFLLSDTAKRLRVVLQALTNEGVPMASTWALPVR